MISCHLWNGLGNQLFAMATTMAHAWRNNGLYAFPEQTLQPQLWQRRMKHLPTLPEGWMPSMVYQELHRGYQELPYEEIMCLSGYFQSEKYFIDYRDRILKEFNFKWQPEPGVVAIHIRRGDYLSIPNLFVTVSEDYLLKAIAHFPKKRFRFYSDDITWCKDFCNKHGMEAEFSEGKNEVEDLESMSGCESQICSNSTYAWWAFFLNQNPDKVGVFPSEWYGIDNQHLINTDLYPQKSIII